MNATGASSTAGDLGSEIASRSCAGADDCQLAQATAPLTGERRGVSGAYPLHDGRDAFATRVLLANAAERTLDVQYYIWRGDLSGTLLFEALLRAADRGVRVRLLLDDNNTQGMDGTLATLASHPHVEMRLFNAYRHRRWRWLELLADFSRLNRRMHNKSFTADGQVTIVGGRNIGDEYFDAGHDTLFVDLDVLAVGPVVADVMADFERYWNSEAATHTESILAPAVHDGLDAFARAAERCAAHPRAAAYLQSLQDLPVVRDLLTRRLPWIWAPIRMISDDPAKVLAKAKPRDLLIRRLQDVLGTLRSELCLLSPYFVPTVRGREFFAERARAGIRVSILTNAMEATDVIVVHAGYVKHRKALLRAGVRLFELRRHTPRRKRLLRVRGLAGSSSASLHAKTFTIDRQRMFVGSFNFDQRSARLNTEIGFFIESAELAVASASEFASQIPANAYEVRLQAGALEWVERNGDEQIIHQREPGSTFWQRLAVRVLSWLPIDWLL